MASSIPIQTIENPVLGRPFFLRKNRHSSIPSGTTTTTITPSAKLRLSELLGGRGLCNGEQGLQKELHQRPAPSPTNPEPRSGGSPSSLPLGFGADAFEKELLGLTGGFPGGEKGLEKFIEENPPIGKEEAGIVFSGSKPKPPELPLLLPGMIVIVKNPKNPFYMFCGIVQRVTDGKVGVLFEGGNWDKLITFQLDELERRDKGPPMVNPKSAVLESIVQKSP